MKKDIDNGMECRIIGMFFVLCLLLSGCTEDAGVDEDYLLRVNNYSISSDEVDSSLKIEAELDSNFYPSTDTKVEYLKGLVQSQLLIQEAKSQKLDEQELFRQTIQRYWESTLIRDLLANKGEQLRKTTLVTKEEIEAYYKENRDFLPEGTLEDLKLELTEKLTEQKVNLRLADWIEELKASATIEIKDPELAARIIEK